MEWYRRPALVLGILLIPFLGAFVWYLDSSKPCKVFGEVHQRQKGEMLLRR